MTQEINRGSVWRKWDLHIHTPFSICEEYGDTPENWEKFICALENLPEDIKVIGITDYYFIDGYTKVMNYKLKQNRLKNLEKIFPILEFRIDTFGSGSENKLQKINLHILFNLDETKLDEEIKLVRDEFINKINISSLDKHKTKSLSKENFIAIGGDLKTGFQSLIPSTKQVFDLIDTITWKEKTFLFLGYKEWSNLEKNQQLKPLKDDLYSKVGAFFSNNFQNNFANQSWLNEFGNKKLLHSLDIHKFDFIDTFEFDEKGLKKPIVNYHCNTWIKADPTFEGLQQIIYEPNERVFIGEQKPDQKISYQVIDRIEFFDNDNGSRCFGSDPILFNTNLNAVIGSRSSGKSALLLYLANNIVPDFIQREGIRGPANGKEWSDVTNIECKVFWNNGQDNQESPGKIIYIPQGYLIKISDPGKLKKEIIPIIEEKFESKFNLYKDVLVEFTEINKLISGDLTDYYVLKNEILELNKTNQGIGALESIQKVISEKDEQIKKLNSNTITPEEIEEYREFYRSLSSLNEDGKKYNKILSEIKDFTGEKIVINLSGIGVPLYGIDSEITQIINKVYSDHKISILDEIKKNILDYQTKIQLMSTKNNNELLKLADDKKDLVARYTKNSELIKLIQEHDVEKKKIVDIAINLKTIKTNEEQMKLKIESVVTRLSEKNKKEMELIKVFNDSSTEVDGVNFGVEINNNIQHENRIIESFFDLRGTAPDFILNRDDLRIIDHTYLTNHVEEVLKKLSNGDYRLKSGNEDVNVAIGLFTIDQEIRFYGEMDGDKIGGFSPTSMSQGKQSLFALRLILGSSNDKWPLLIDQPEDDLDARSIYDEIVPFLKKKKKERQIIMVSHNANLVVGADAEEIIIANKDSTQRPNINGYTFNYKSGSIESSKSLVETEIDTLNKQGIREHSCEILDGGKDAFEQRKKKYHIN